MPRESDHVIPMNTTPSPLEQHRRKTRVLFTEAQAGIRGGTAGRTKKSLSKEDEKLLAFLLNPVVDGAGRVLPAIPRIVVVVVVYGLLFVVLAALYVHKGSAESKDSDEKIEASLRRIEESLGTLPDAAPQGDRSSQLPHPEQAS